MDEHATRADLELRLRDSEARCRLMIESWAQAAWETDPHGFVVSDSPSWRAYTGQTMEEWLGFGWLDAIHPDDRAYAEQQWREAIAALGPVNAEFRLRAPTGGWRWTNVRAAPVLDADGKIEKWAGMNVDIDARKTAEAALRESEERLHVALASAKLGTFVWHVAEDRTEEDARARAHFGLPPDGTISLADALATTFHPDDGPRYAAAVARAIDPAGPGRLNEEYRIRHPDGQERWMSTTAITTFEGTPRAAVRLTGALADVTDRKRAEAALLESEERQAFLLRLSDALRPLADPVAVQEVAARMLGEHLGLDRAYYITMDDARRIGTVEREFRRIYMPSLIGRHPFNSYGYAVELLRAGQRVIVSDAETDPAIGSEDVAPYRALSFRAFLHTPLIKGGELVCAMGAVSATPRDWTEADADLERLTKLGLAR